MATFFALVIGLAWYSATHFLPGQLDGGGATPSPSPLAVSPAATPAPVAAATPDPTPPPDAAFRDCLANMKTLSTAMDMYGADHMGHYPTRLEGLLPTYVRTVPTCPGGEGDAYIYNASTAPDAYTLICGGWNHRGTNAGRFYPRIGSWFGVQAHNPDLDIAPVDAQTYFNRGFAFYQRGDYPRAVIDLEHAASLSPKWSAPLYYHAECLLEQKRYDQAVDQYTRALDLQKSALYYTGRAAAYTQLTEYDKATADYLQADKLVSKDPDTYANYAFVLYLQGKFQEAINVSNASLKRNLRNERAYVTRYWCELCMGQGAAVATDAQNFLGTVGWKSYQSPYSVVIGSFGYSMDKRDAEAKALLDSGLARLRHDWPYPSVQYLAGQIGQDSLLTAATDSEKQTEAWFYIGMKAALEGRKDDARKAFTWVRDNGKNTFFEYRAALSWLARL